MTMTTSVYVGIAEGDRETGYSLFFPDLNGCVTAADTLEELAVNAREVLAFHLEGMEEYGLVIPPPTPVDDIPHDPDVVEVGIMLVEVERNDPPVRVNVSLTSSLLQRVDRAAKQRGMTRSAFLSEGAKVLLKTG